MAVRGGACFGLVSHWVAEPHSDAAQDRGAAEDDGELIEAGGQASLLLEAFVGALDDVVALVELGVAAGRPLVCAPNRTRGVKYCAHASVEERHR